MSSVSHFYGYDKMSEKYGDRDRIIGVMKNMHTGSLVTNNGIGQLFNGLFLYIIIQCRPTVGRLCCSG